MHFPNVPHTFLSVAHQLEHFLATALIAAEDTHDPAGDHVDPRRAHAARGHAGMARLDHHGHAARLEVVPDALGDLGGELFLDLQAAGEAVEHARELGNPHDVI